MSVLKIKQGDEWVNILTGGGSADINQIPADWNQNDIAAPNYIRNRTHYEMPAYEVVTQVIPREYYPVQSETAEEGMYMFGIESKINGDPQAEYIVTLDGVEYKETMFSLMGTSILGDISILSAMTGGVPEFSDEKPYVLISTSVIEEEMGYGTIGITKNPPANGNSYNVGVRAIGKYLDKEILPKTECKISAEGTGVITTMIEAVPGCTYKIVYDDVVYNAPASTFSILETMGGIGGGNMAELMFIMMLFGGMGNMDMITIGESMMNLLPTSNKIEMPKYPFSITSIPMLGISMVYDFSPKFPHLVRLDRMIDDVTSEVILPMKTRMGFSHPILGYVWDCGEVSGIDTTSTYRLRDSNMNEYTTTPYVWDDGITVELEFYTPGVCFIYNQENNHLYYRIQDDYEVSAAAQTHTIQIEGCSYPIKKLDPKFIPNSGGMNPLMMMLMSGGFGISTNASTMSLRSENTVMTTENSSESKTEFDKLNNLLFKLGFDKVESNPMLKSIVAAKSLM